MVRRLKDVLSRLRAALTPQAAVLLAAALLLFWLAANRQSGALPLEERLARTLSCIEGAGRVEVTIRTREVRTSGGTLGASQKEDVPGGAVIVAQGAQDPLVEMELREAACVLLGLPASSVSVVTGGK